MPGCDWQSLAEFLDKAILGCRSDLSHQSRWRKGILPAHVGVNGLILIILAHRSVCEDERSSL